MPAVPGQTPKPKSRGKLIGLIVAVVIALALGVGLALFFTYRAGIWGGTPLPTAEEISGASGGEATADDVVTQLKAKGVKASKSIIFSGEKKDVFLGYEGMKPGDRVQKDGRFLGADSLSRGSDHMAARKILDRGLPLTPEQVADALLDYYDLGVRNFLIRGFDPLNDAQEYGKALLPIAREKAALRAVAERAS